eukprot:3941106-Rhodomonas_salina.3
MAPSCAWQEHYHETIRVDTSHVSAQRSNNRVGLARAAPNGSLSTACTGRNTSTAIAIDGSVAGANSSVATMDSSKDSRTVS